MKEKEGGWPCDSKSKKDTVRRLQIANFYIHFRNLLHQPFQWVKAQVQHKRNLRINHNTLSTESLFYRFISVFSSDTANPCFVMHIHSFSLLPLIMKLAQGSSCTQGCMLQGMQNPLFRAEFSPVGHEFFRPCKQSITALQGHTYEKGSC